MRTYGLLGTLAGGFLGFALTAIAYGDHVGWPALGVSLVLAAVAFLSRRRYQASRARFGLDPGQGTAPERTATIRIDRTNNRWNDRLRSYDVMIDDGYAGRIKRGETVQVPVLPGTHHVYLTIDWCRSRTIAAQPAPGETVTVTCSARPALLAFFYITFGYQRYIRLETATLTAQ